MNYLLMFFFKTLNYERPKLIVFLSKILLTNINSINDTTTQDRLNTSDN